MTARGRKFLTTIVVLLALIGAGVGVLAYENWDRTVILTGLLINYVRSFGAPPGTLVTERAPDGGDSVQIIEGQSAESDDWQSYNKTLTSARYSPLAQINAQNVHGLKLLCIYDTGQYTGFESGLIVVNGAMIAATEHDIFSIDPATCRQNWRVHEDYTPATPQAVNRGAAYLDGRLFRGTEDGRALAYDFATGKRLWETSVANPKIGETTPSSPIAWDGLVFIGTAGGDIKGAKGRMYALDAKTGKIVWEFYLVPKSDKDPVRGPQGASPLDHSSWKNGPNTPITGGGTWTSYTLDPQSGLLYVPGGNPGPDFATAPRPGKNLYSGSVVVLDAKTGNYRNHFKLVPKDWHDYDVSTAPAVVKTRSGKTLLSVAPKDGHLYGFDLATNAMLYKTEVTRFENDDAPFTAGKPVHFCPGSIGGAEWNGPAYDPRTNLVLIGEVEWCSSVTLASDQSIENVKLGKPWSGNDTINPFHTWGTQDNYGRWAGWVYAVDADSGRWMWRAKTNYPVMSGMTPTAGGLVFFGDMGGHFYALDAASGEKLWEQKTEGGIGGGVITYSAGGAQKVAAAAGFTSILWPTQVATGKILIFGLEW
ncbi:MAG TPA: PQQ-binding-like beta-propeller repeat protein [Methylocella sp.]|jgi:alcohol dehydrogenase (cytochrome c)|nr:PQQ-binding-like beta-propeller repeat protein [Methylocella sp.]